MLPGLRTHVCKSASENYSPRSTKDWGAFFQAAASHGAFVFFMPFMVNIPIGCGCIYRAQADECQRRSPSAAIPPPSREDTKFHKGSYARAAKRWTLWPFAPSWWKLFSGFRKDPAQRTVRGSAEDSRRYSSRNPTFSHRGTETPERLALLCGLCVSVRDTQDATQMHRMLRRNDLNPFLPPNYRKNAAVPRALMITLPPPTASVTSTPPSCAAV